MVKKMDITVEICCGGYEDALQAAKGGAERVELNTGLYMGGLTPCTGTLKLVKKDTDLKVISMVRPRGGGFCYTDAEFRSMLRDATELLEAGSDGIVYGFLKADGSIDKDRTGEMTRLIHSYGKTAVFHRALDCVGASDTAMEELISLNVDRALTSGGRKTAWEGRDRIKQLQEKFGSMIQILAGSGINEENAGKFVNETGVRQIHSSCKSWRKDATAKGRDVSYAYVEGAYSSMFEIVSEQKTRKLLMALKDKTTAVEFRDAPL